MTFNPSESRFFWNVGFFSNFWVCVLELPLLSVTSSDPCVSDRMSSWEHSNRRFVISHLNGLKSLGLSPAVEDGSTTVAFCRSQSVDLGCTWLLWFDATRWRCLCCALFPRAWSPILPQQGAESRLGWSSHLFFECVELLVMHVIICVYIQTWYCFVSCLFKIFFRNVAASEGRH